MEEPQSSAPRRMEAYLDAILASLPRRLSAFQLEELRRELRTHLWERVAAYEELGQTEDEAVTEALIQFGGSKDFVKQWRQEWAKPPCRVTLREVWEAAYLALPISVSALLLSWLPQLLVFYQFSRDRNGPSGWFYSHYNAFTHIWLCLFFMLPVALGLLVKQRTKRYATLGILVALTMNCLLGSLISATDAYLWEQAVGYRELVNQITWSAALWIPIACGTAALSGWWTRRAEGRRVA